MIIPDVNLLLYAYNSEARLHAAARDWWTNLLGGPEQVGLAWVTILGFDRARIVGATIRCRSGDIDRPKLARIAGRTNCGTR